MCERTLPLRKERNMRQLRWLCIGPTLSNYNSPGPNFATD